MSVACDRRTWRRFGCWSRYWFSSHCCPFTPFGVRGFDGHRFCTKPCSSHSPVGLWFFTSVPVSGLDGAGNKCESTSHDWPTHQLVPEATGLCTKPLSHQSSSRQFVTGFFASDPVSCPDGAWRDPESTCHHRFFHARLSVGSDGSGALSETKFQL